MKRIIALVLSLIMVLSLAACGSQSNTPAETTGTSADQGQTAATDSASDGAADSTEEVTEIVEENWNKTLSIGITTDPVILGVGNVGGLNTGKQMITPFLLQCLVCVVPDLENKTTITYYTIAKDYEQIDDTTYEVHLREGVYDTAGNDLKASDVVFSYDIAKSLSSSATMAIIDHLEAIDDYTVRFYVTEALNVGDFIDILTAASVFTEKAYNDSSDQLAVDVIGTSGFVVEEFVEGSHAILKKADLPYWNEAANETKSIEDGYCPQFDCTNIDRFEFHVITDTSTLALALENGDIDFAPNVGIQDAMLFANDSENYTVATRPDNMQVIWYNSSASSPTNSKNLRLAISHCIDSEGILNSAYDGHGITLSAWAYPTYSDYQSEWDDGDYFNYDINKAKEYFDAYLKESGTTAADLKLNLVVQTGSALNKVAQTIQQYVGELTGNPTCVEIFSYDRASFNSAISDPGAYDLAIGNCQTISRTFCAYNWSYYLDLRKNNTEVFHSGDEKLQNLLLDAIRESSHSDKNVAAFQEYIDEQCYMKALTCGDVYMVSKSWITGLDNALGFKLCPNVGVMSFDWANSGKGTLD